MDIQLSPNKIIPGIPNIWHEQNNEADIIMDIKKLTFRTGSLNRIYAFHILDHLFLSEIKSTLDNWKSCLKPGGEIFLIVDDFELLARKFISGEISIDDYNSKFMHPTNFTKEYLIGHLANSGFINDNMRIWFNDIEKLYSKSENELIISAKNG